MSHQSFAHNIRDRFPNAVISVNQEGPQVRFSVLGRPDLGSATHRVEDLAPTLQPRRSLGHATGRPGNSTNRSQGTAGTSSNPTGGLLRGNSELVEKVIVGVLAALVVGFLLQR